MKQNMTVKTLRVLNGSGLALNIVTAVRYVVTSTNPDIDVEEFATWRSVVNYLLDDDKMMTIARKDYERHLEGDWNHDHLVEWFEMYLAEFAEQAGYKIEELK